MGVGIPAPFSDVSGLPGRGGSCSGDSRCIVQEQILLLILTSIRNRREDQPPAIIMKKFYRSAVLHRKVSGA